MKTIIPSFSVLLDGYGKTVDHAISLAAASGQISDSQSGTRLALAELAQEEVGKSFSILSAFCLPSDPRLWQQFWVEFRDHELKSNRAFFYEWFEPTRINITIEDGSKPDGKSRFKRMSQEKNVGLYVDFDKSIGKFVSPADLVKKSDVATRIISVINLAQKARAIFTILTDDDVEFSVCECSKIALRICTTRIYQKQMKSVFEDFASQSDRHRDLRDKIDEGMRMTANALKDLVHRQATKNDT